ncbi:DCL family protein [Vibrio diabolicus]|uniref:DCL family protein n=1 Tax=Vibrio diabolicus TaxID=50719 RepID=UPI00374FE91C
MFRLGPYEYSSKEALKKKLKAFLKGDNEGDITHPQLIDKLSYLLMLHPDAERKIGSGINGFKVERNYQGSGKSFVVIRKDYSEERFSYKSCIDGTVATRRSMALEALRFCVRSQMADYRSSIVLPTECGITGKVINSISELHIDHVEPFSVLVKQFCKEYGISLCDLETSSNGETLALLSKEIEGNFQDYHRSQARLQPSLASENMKKSNLTKHLRVIPNA